MTFTYNLSSVDANLLNVSRVRLELGDTELGAGVRPDGSNLQDEEILIWLEEEDNDIQQAVGRACAALANAWTTVGSITVGPRREELSQIAKGWADRAQAILPFSSADYAVKVVPIDQKHNPYRYRPEDEAGL